MGYVIGAWYEATPAYPEQIFVTCGKYVGNGVFYDGNGNDVSSVMRSAPHLEKRG